MNENTLNPEQLQKLTEVFQVLFNDSTLILRDDLTASNVPNWDSFNHLNLVLSIEKAFGIRFSNMEVAGMQNVGDLKKILSGKLSEKT
jgi:acyl carrier protein